MPAGAAALADGKMPATKTETLLQFARAPPLHQSSELSTYALGFEGIESYR